MTERMVVGWRVSGGIDDVNAHQGKTIRPRARGRLSLAFTFVRAAVVYWTDVFPRVCLHIARWRRLARGIPDPVLRRFAFEALAKRGNMEGAAAFAAFAPRGQRAAVARATSAFQAAYNLLDMLGEQPSADPILDGRCLHEALLFALTPPGKEANDAEHAESSARAAAGAEPHPGEGATAMPRDWYEYHPQCEDGGYLDALLHECRTAVATLPSYQTAASSARASAARIVAFQSLNLSETQGDHEGLEHWALDATPPGSTLRWWETAAAAGSSLGVHVLIGAAAEKDLDAREVQALSDAYFPWIGGLHSMLDNLIDKHEDEAAGHRSLIEYYSPQRAAQRMHWLATQAAQIARELPHSSRHIVILAAMIGNYLSTPEAQSRELRSVTGSVLETVGELRRPTMLVFTLRRLPSHIPTGLPHIPFSRKRRLEPNEVTRQGVDNFG
jgi:tetraprenyl-beta-curcumene synthase